MPGDIAAGVYTHKSDDFSYPFHPPQGVELHANEHGLYEMPKVATGFMRLRRAVVEALYKREHDRGRCSRPGDELGDMRRSPLPVARIVERGFPKELGLEEVAGNDLYTSGDYVLSLKARSLGFKCWVDPDMDFDHAGEKVWSGHFGNLYRQRNGLFQPEFAAAVAELRKGNAAPEIFQSLATCYGVQDRNYMPWPLTPESLEALYSQARETAGDVLETGSGLSTLVLGLALAGTDRTVHALEHDVYFWRKTAGMLEQFGIPNVMLHLLPLEPQDDGTVAYAETDLPESVGLALIDGPPGKYGRAGVVRALLGRLKSAVLVIDDADREEELLTMLRDTTHDFQIKPGLRWWAIATPKTQAVREAAE